MKTAFFLFLSFASLPICYAAKIPKPVLDSVVTVFPGAAASASAAISAVFFDQKKEIAKELKSKGIDTTDGAIFSLYFRVDPDASGRWLLHPNVYALVQIEGRNDFIPASIAKNYRGQEWMVSVYGTQIRPGGRVLVHILDDKQLWNTAFNSILQMEIPLQIGASVSLTPAFPIQVQAGGKIRLLNRNIELQRPGYVASADFTVPDVNDGIWLASADLIKNGAKVGNLEFGQVWRAPARSGILWNAVFWGGIAIVFGALFFRGLIARPGTLPQKEPPTG